MCTTCGCQSDQVRIEGDDGHHHHHHPAGKLPFAMSPNRTLAALSQQVTFKRETAQTPPADLHFGQGVAGLHVPGISQARMVTIEQNILAKNDEFAAQNRAWFNARGQLAVNLVSSPGSGKTTLLTETLKRLSGRRACGVIEGDQQTLNDAERIRATGTPAIQVNTGKGCHLDAQMIHQALPRLGLAQGGLLFIENVGNLVCPASFDLGEAAKIVVLSVTEGEDKPLKYPPMFAAASLMLLNKVDLLPWLKFDVSQCLAYARQVNPQIQIIQTSATSGEGLDSWINWLEMRLCV